MQSVDYDNEVKPDNELEKSQPGFSGFYDLDAGGALRFPEQPGHGKAHPVVAEEIVSQSEKELASL